MLIEILPPVMTGVAVASDKLPVPANPPAAVALPIFKVVVEPGLAPAIMLMLPCLPELLPPLLRVRLLPVGMLIVPAPVPVPAYATRVMLPPLPFPAEVL